MNPGSRTCLVTGANAGIGRAAALQLAQAGHRVILGCRDAAKGMATARAIEQAVAGARVEPLLIDLSLQRSIREAAARIDAVDVVIHNAAYFDVRVARRTVTDEGVETTWATNYLGPVLLTELLLPKLRARPGARVIAVTSKGLALFPRLAVDLDDPELVRRRFRVSRAYYQSKLALLGWSLELADRLRSDGVQVHAVRVTNVKIDRSRYPGLAWYLRAMYAVKSAFSISAEEMARTYVWLATSEAPGAQHGGYWDGIDRPARASRWAADPANRAALAAYTRTRLASPADLVAP